MDLNDEIISDEVYDGKLVKDMNDRATLITAASYHNAEPEKVPEACSHIDKDQHKKLYLLWKKYELLFDGTLGIWNTDPVDILLK